MSQINETTTDDLVDIELLAGALDKIIIKDSIAVQVSDLQRLSGPNGRINGVIRDTVNDTLSITTELAEAVSRTIKTEFTPETLYDFKQLYKEDFYDVLAHYLSDELAYKLDADFFVLINEKAKIKTPISFDTTYDNNIYDVVTQVFAKINKERVLLSSTSKRPLKNFAIVTPNVASLLMNNSILAQDLDKGDSGVSLLGGFAGMDIYLDNTHDYTVNAVDSVIIGTKGNGFSKGATVYAPYNQTFLKSTKYESGELRYFLLDRAAIVMNPSDNKGTNDSKFLVKFDIDLSALALYQ